MCEPMNEKGNNQNNHRERQMYRKIERKSASRQFFNKKPKFKVKTVKVKYIKTPK